MEIAVSGFSGFYYFWFLWFPVSPVSVSLSVGRSAFVNFEPAAVSRNWREGFMKIKKDEVNQYNLKGKEREREREKTK